MPPVKSTTRKEIRANAVSTMNPMCTKPHFSPPCGSLGEVRAAIRANGGTKNQFIVWDDLTASSMTEAAFEYARATLCGEQIDMAKAVKSSFPSKIKVSDKQLDKCTFIYTEDYRVL
jgi:hypothetical protein